MVNIDSLFHEQRHAISFYDDEKNNQITLDSLHELANYFLSHGYGVVYGIEEFRSDNKDSTNSIARKIVEAKRNLDGSSDGVKIQQSDKPDVDKLMIIDPNSMYADNNSSHDIVNYWSAQYSKAAQRFGIDKNNVKGIVGINMPDPYFEKKQFDKFFEFEHQIERVFDGKLGLICWYKKKWVEELTLPQFIRMINTHGHVISADLSILKWSVNKVLDIITKTIDSDPNIEDSKKENKEEKEDNNAFSNLLFETIRNLYHLDRNSLVREPDKFEEILIRMLGKDSYGELSMKIKNNFMKEIFGYSEYVASS